MLSTLRPELRREHSLGFLYCTVITRFDVFPNTLSFLTVVKAKLRRLYICFQSNLIISPDEEKSLYILQAV